MALTVTGLGSGATTTTGTTVAVTLTAAVAVNDLIVACVAVDNTGTNGAAPATLTVTDSKSQPYHAISTGLVDPGAASAGAYAAMFVGVCTTAMTTSDTVTVTTGTAAAMNLHVYKVTPGTGKLVYLGTKGGATTTAGTSATVTTGSLASGEAVIGMAAIERGNATKNLSVTADPDTTNGSWSGQVATQGRNSATSATDMTGVSQAKVATGVGTQTYNVAWTTATDAVIRYATFVEADPILPGVKIPFRAVLYAGDPAGGGTDGVAVASWRNGGIEGGSFVQATGTSQPVYRASVASLNSKPALELTEFDDQISWAAGRTLPLPFTILLVSRSKVSGSGPTVKLIGTGGAEIGINPSPSMFAYAGGTGINDGPAGAVRNTATNFLAAGVFAAGAAGKLIAGTTAAGASTTTGTTGTSAGNSLILGNTTVGNTTEGWNGYVALGVLYLGDLTAHPNYSALLSFIDSEWLDPGTPPLSMSAGAASASDGGASIALSTTLASGAASTSVGGAAITRSTTLASGAVLASTGGAAITRSTTMSAGADAASSGGVSIVRVRPLDAGVTATSAGGVSITRSTTLSAGAALMSAGGAALIRRQPLASGATSTSTGGAAITRTTTLTSGAPSASTGGASITLSTTLASGASSTSAGGAAITIVGPGGSTYSVSAGAAAASAGGVSIALVRPLTAGAASTSTGGASITRSTTMSAGAAAASSGGVSIVRVRPLDAGVTALSGGGVSITRSTTLSAGASATSVGGARIGRSTMMTAGAAAASSGGAAIGRSTVMSAGAAAVSAGHVSIFLRRAVTVPAYAPLRSSLTASRPGEGTLTASGVSSTLTASRPGEGELSTLGTASGLRIVE